MDGLEPPNRLRGKILASIQREEMRRARIRVYAALTTVTASSLGVVFVFAYMFEGFYQSIFYRYFSLLFSDPDIAVSYWKELLLSLAETAPLVGITLSLVALATLLTAMRVLANTARPHLMPSWN